MIKYLSVKSGFSYALRFAISVLVVACSFSARADKLSVCTEEFAAALMYDAEVRLPVTGPFAMIQPDGMAVLDEQTIFVSDSAAHKIIRLDDGIPSAVGSGRGAAPGHFLNPGGLATYPGNRLAVVDSGNHRIQILDNRLKHVLSIGRYGTGDGRLKRPLSVYAVSYGDLLDGLLITDSGNSRLALFGPGGEFHAQLAAHGALEEPVAAIVLENRSIVVADWGGQALLQLDSFGRKIRTIRPCDREEYRPTGLYSPGGSLVIASDWHNGKLDVIDLNRQVITTLSEAGGTRFNAPSAVIGEGDLLYLLDTMNYRIVRFRLSDAHVLTHFSRSPSTAGIDMPLIPVSIAGVKTEKDDVFLEDSEYLELLRYFYRDGDQVTEEVQTPDPLDGSGAAGTPALRIRISQ